MKKKKNRDTLYAEEFKSSTFNPFQQAYAYVLQHGIDMVNADMQNFKHLEENIIAVATADRYFS